MVNSNFKSKTILITGARGGFGREAAIILAKKGHQVIATVHREESVAELKKYAAEQQVSLEVFKLDITLPEDRQKIANFDIDVLINNAAIAQSGSLTEIPFERLRANFETNLFDTLALTQAALEPMLKKNSGRIIFISSMAGRIVMPFWGSYNMTKFSLSAAADVMRQELRLITKKVFISVVEPGTYHTEFNQKCMATKYEWMNEQSYFFKIIAQIKKTEARYFGFLELKNLRSLVNKIILATEAPRPRLRYSAPGWQAAGVQLLRIFGK